jgi:hypothetical protein
MTGYELAATSAPIEVPFNGDLDTQLISTEILTLYLTVANAVDCRALVYHLGGCRNEAIFPTSDSISDRVGFVRFLA